MHCKAMSEIPWTGAVKLEHGPISDSGGKKGAGLGYNKEMLGLPVGVTTLNGPGELLRSVSGSFHKFVSCAHDICVTVADNVCKSRIKLLLIRSLLQLQTAYGMIDRDMAEKTWAMGDAFTMADCAAAPPLFYANKVLPFGDAATFDVRIRIRVRRWTPAEGLHAAI